MLIKAVVAFFKYKIVGSVIILACWPSVDQIKLTRQISRYGLSATFSCNQSVLDHIDRHRLQGVLYLSQREDNEILQRLQKVKRHQFMTMYKWLVIGDRLPELGKVRYDADVTFLELRTSNNVNVRNSAAFISQSSQVVYFSDAYIHPRDGVAIHPWAYWTSDEGFVLTDEGARILRRQDLQEYALRIATPVGHFNSERYDGTFIDWLEDESISDQDPGIRSGYQISILLVEAVNGKAAVIMTELWASTLNNSMYAMVANGDADLSGAILRILDHRTYIFDYVVRIWPFRVGFTYLAERESSTNMYLEPFSPRVWWACLGMLGVLAVVQRLTSKNTEEQDGAFYTVLTTYLQQDASAVPKGVSGRWSFIVLSVSAMLVHAYYTSAIVSALMSTGTGGPTSLRALADSKYAIACEDYDSMRYMYFDGDSSWNDLEYLKKKKMTSKFYVDFDKGLELLQQGGTAFHGEYNQLYPHFKTFTDDQLCKLQYLDTVPETLTWVTSTKNSEWTGMLRVAAEWLQETGLGKRLVNRLRIPQPPCRSALLAKRVNIEDIKPLLIVTVLGAVLSVIILVIELMFAKVQRSRGRVKRRTETGFNKDVSDLSDVVDMKFSSI